MSIHVQGLTSWGWLLIGAYFLVATTASLDVLLLRPGLAEHTKPSALAAAAQRLLGLATAYVPTMAPTTAPLFVCCGGSLESGRF